MDTDDETWADDIHAKREIFRQSLVAIASDVSMALRDAGLHFPVYLTVPNSGEALATFATPLDPSDADWSEVSAIVTRIVSKTLGDLALRTRPQECSVARASMSAAEVTSD